MTKHVPFLRFAYRKFFEIIAAFGATVYVISLSIKCVIAAKKVKRIFRKKSNVVN